MSKLLPFILVLSGCYPAEPIDIDAFKKACDGKFTHSLSQVKNYSPTIRVRCDHE